MTPKTSFLLGGLTAAAVLVCALPVANSIGASSSAVVPVFEINRTAKGNRLQAPNLSVIRKIPTLPPAEPRRPAERDEARKLMDGCEPLFSPVSSPTLSHLAGSCVG